MLSFRRRALRLVLSFETFTQAENRGELVGEAFRAALAREALRLRNPRYLKVAAIVGLVSALALAGMVIRGDAGGVDAQAYWVAGRAWLSGGDPYHPSGAFLPYVYAPWQLPLFVPWALLPWAWAWLIWRGATILGLLITIRWAYVRRPRTTAILLAVLAFPLVVNLDTGNINLPLVLALFGAQFCGPMVNGLVWMMATTIKWIPALIWPLMSREARYWGLIWLLPAVVLTLLNLNGTMEQLGVLFSFPRPPRLDYLVFLWALVPWAWRHPEMFRFLVPSAWRALPGQVKSYLRARTASGEREN